MSSLPKDTRATVIPCLGYRDAPAAIEWDPVEATGAMTKDRHACRKRGPRNQTHRAPAEPRDMTKTVAA